MAQPPTVRRLRIDDETFGPLLLGEVAVISNVPDDVTIVGMYHDHARDCFYLKIQSDEFSPVSEGEIIPEFDIKCERAIPVSDERLKAAFDEAAELMADTPEP